MPMLSNHVESSVKDHQDNPSISYTTRICYSVSINPIFSSSQFWIVDSGATRHICSNAAAFSSLRSVRNSSVTLPNHIQIFVSLCGDISLNSMIILKYVLFIPQFKFNLLSVSALTNGSQLTIGFLRDSFIIQDIISRRMIGKGEKVEDLYVLDTNTLNSVSTACVNNVSTHFWHNRLGHLSFKRLNILKQHIHCDTSRINKNDPCYICPLAKQRRLSFVSHNHMSSFPFDLIHCDIWGPYHTPSHSGHRFFSTLVGDCTRFTWVFLLK